MGWGSSKIGNRDRKPREKKLGASKTEAKQKKGHEKASVNRFGLKKKSTVRFCPARRRKAKKGILERKMTKVSQPTAPKRNRIIKSQGGTERGKENKRNY